jgi:hypothetical protein
MRYYEAEPRPRRAGPGLVIGIGVAIVAIAAVVTFLWNPDDDSSGSDGATPASVGSDTAGSTSPESSTPVTATVVLATTVAPSVTNALVPLVDDCAQYVPTAIYFGEASMQAFWDAAGGTTEGLLAACERLAVENPAELQRMSDAYHALQALAAATTTG